ncbi:MAG TPA: hypothetical protein VGI64_04290 [Streptosporangiaceae bacterium]
MDLIVGAVKRLAEPAGPVLPWPAPASSGESGGRAAGRRFARPAVLAGVATWLAGR